MGNLRIINEEPEKDVESLLATLRRIAEENKRERIDMAMLKFLDDKKAQAPTGKTRATGIPDWHKKIVSSLSEPDEQDISTTEGTELQCDTKTRSDAEIEKIRLFREKSERELSQFDSRIINMAPELQRYLRGIALRVVASMWVEDIWGESFSRIQKVDNFIRENEMSDPEADRIQLFDAIEEIRTLALFSGPKNQKKIRAMVFISIAEGFEENTENIPPEILLRIGEAGQKSIEVIREARKKVDKDPLSPEILKRIDEWKNGVMATSVGDTTNQHSQIIARRRAVTEERIGKEVEAVYEDLNNTSQKPLYKKLRSIFSLDELVSAIFGNIQNL